MVSKTINLTKIIGFLFSNFSTIVLVLIGLGLIILAIYMKMKDLDFKKNGVPVKLKVKNVEEIFIDGKNGGKIVNGYKTTFEFSYNGNTKEETLDTSKKFKVDSIIKGIYLAKGKRNVLSVQGEGFYLSKGGEIFLIYIGLLMLFVATHLLVGFSLRIVIYAVLIYFILFFGLVYFFPILVKHTKPKKKNEIHEIYYSDIDNNDYSTVDENLIRYIPKVKKIEKTKVSFGLIFNTIIFVGLGGMACVFGILFSYQSLKIKFTYPSVIGEVSNTYTYKSGDSELIGVVYNYEVDGKDYKLDYKTGKGNLFFTYKVGSKVKLYYEKNNPNNATPKNELGTGAVVLVIGMLFIYVGIYGIVANRKQAKIYRDYVVMEGKKI